MGCWLERWKDELDKGFNDIQTTLYIGTYRNNAKEERRRPRGHEEKIYIKGFKANRGKSGAIKTTGRPIERID